MNIVILSSSFPPVLGGVQVVASSLAIFLQKNGHRVLVVTNKYSKTALPYENMNGIEVHRFWFLQPKKSRGIYSLVHNLFYYINREFVSIKLNKLIARFKPDLCSVQFVSFQPYYMSKIKSLRGVDYYVSLHGHDVLKYERQTTLEYELNKSVYNRGTGMLVHFTTMSKGIIFCSDWLRRKFLELNGTESLEEKCKVVYNFVDFSRFEARQKSTRDIFMFGRLEKHKGFQLVFRSMAASQELKSKYQIKLAGEGKFMPDLVKMAIDLDICGQVNFVGKLSQEELAIELNRAALIVVPSIREPFGITVLEAMASNQRVLFSDVGGIPEVVGNTSPMFSVDESPEELALSMISVLSSSLTSSDLADRWARVKSFSKERFLSDYNKVLFNKSVRSSVGRDQ